MTQRKILFISLLLNSSCEIIKIKCCRVLILVNFMVRDLFLSIQLSSFKDNWREFYTIPSIKLLIPAKASVREIHRAYICEILECNLALRCFHLYILLRWNWRDISFCGACLSELHTRNHLRELKVIKANIRHRVLVGRNFNPLLRSTSFHCNVMA